MRITFRGESERVLREVSQKLGISPTELLTHHIFSLEKFIHNRAHIEEVKNELQKPHKRVVQQS